MSRGLARATDGSRGKGNSFCPIERTDESSRFPQKVSLFSIVSPRAVDNDCLRKPFFVSLRRERAIHLVHESPFAGKAESYSTICLPRFVLRYYMQSASRVKSRRVARGGCSSLWGQGSPGESIRCNHSATPPCISFPLSLNFAAIAWQQPLSSPYPPALAAWRGEQGEMGGGCGQAAMPPAHTSVPLIPLPTPLCGVGGG